ncbi:MAG TPA: hypothetical protein VGJ46_11870 [Candidatus Limnocylindrales bacterium]|jgi:hypothetical protein
MPDQHLDVRTTPAAGTVARLGQTPEVEEAGHHVRVGSLDLGQRAAQRQ